nr:uncharacterized protein LOC129261847 [Lytechinus pictus]
MTYAIALNDRYGIFSQELITMQVYFYIVSICNTIMFVVCYRDKCMPYFRRHWNSSVTSLQTRRTHCSLDKTTLNTKYEINENQHKTPVRYNKWAMLVTVTCTCVMLINIAGMVFSTFGFGLNPLTSMGICGPWLSEPFCGINLIFAVYSNAAYAFPGALFSLICHNISLQFENLSEEFDQALNSSHPIDKKTLNCFRRRHAVICHTVEVADDVFSPFVGVVYLTNIPLIIFLLYELFYLANGNLLYISMTLCWLLVCSTNVLLPSLFAVQVYEKAHSLRRRVHELQMDTFDSDLSQVQLLFLARLDGPEIGMTALGCFVITKERVLAMGDIKLKGLTAFKFTPSELRIPPFEKARTVLEGLSAEPPDVKPMKGGAKKGEQPDLLHLCHTVPLEVIAIGAGGYTADGKASDYSDFMKWLQCYYQDGMKNMVDHNARTIWFSGPPGPMTPKDEKSRKIRSPKKRPKATDTDDVQTKVKSKRKEGSDIDVPQKSSKRPSKRKSTATSATEAVPKAPRPSQKRRNSSKEASGEKSEESQKGKSKKGKGTSKSVQSGKELKKKASVKGRKKGKIHAQVREDEKTEIVEQNGDTSKRGKGPQKISRRSAKQK